MDKDDLPLIKVVFKEGEAIKVINEYIRQISSEAVWMFGSDNITTVSQEKEEAILNVWTIDCSAILSYVFNFDDSQVVSIPVSMSDVKTQLSLIAAKNGIQFLVFSNANKIVVQKTTGVSFEADAHNYNLIPIIEKPRHIEQDIPEYPRGELDYNCFATIDDFCSACSDLTKKEDKIYIRSCPTGITFEVRKGKSITNVRNFGTRTKTPDNQSLLGDNPMENEFDVIEVNAAYIKAFGKLKKPFNNTIVKMYREEGLPLKIVFRNIFSKLEVCICNRVVKSKN